MILDSTFLVDLDIYATGIAHNLPVVTRNARDFQRIPRPEVIRY